MGVKNGEIIKVIPAAAGRGADFWTMWWFKVNKDAVTTMY